MAKWCFRMSALIVLALALFACDNTGVGGYSFIDQDLQGKIGQQFSFWAGFATGTRGNGRMLRCGEVGCRAPREPDGHRWRAALPAGGTAEVLAVRRRDGFGGWGDRRG